MKLIILDRDGVINQDSDNYIKTVDEWIPIEGSIEAIAALHKHSYNIAVVTNQSGIARQYYSIETLHAMHNKLRQLLRQHNAKVDAIFYCPHGPDDQCTCRKPAIGLYTKVANLFNTELKGVITVGDSFRDLEAALQVGSKPVLVKTGKGERTLANKALEIEQKNIPVFDSLADFVSKTLN